MGNSSKKMAAKCDLLTKEEQKYVGATYSHMSKYGSVKEAEVIVSEVKLEAALVEEYWSPIIESTFLPYINNYLFQYGPNKKDTVDFNRFAELYVFNMRGTSTEKAAMIRECLELQDDSDIPIDKLTKYCEYLTTSYMKLLKKSSSTRVKMWFSKGFRGRTLQIRALAEMLTHAALVISGDEHAATISDEVLVKWLETDVVLLHMSQMVFGTLYGFCGRDDETAASTRPHCSLPNPEGLSTMSDYPVFTDLSHVLWLNLMIPLKHQKKWRFLFSSHVHGESFSTMSVRIVDQGPTIVIIEDHCGYIFGGFASTSWEPGAFHGDELTFLFSLAPKMRLYPSSGFNNHYHYINHNTKTMPNALVMGGQFELPGLWIDADPFGRGSCADSCTTFKNFQRLSKEKDFRIKSLEVWGVGDKPLKLEDSDERNVSALDRDPEAKAILEMAGRERHSDGVREPDMD